MKETKQGYACEPLAGCVYHHEHVGAKTARRLAAPHDQPHIVELIATVLPGRAEHRRHYALDLPQAIAKAAELTTRMGRQRVSVKLCAVRPATDEETEAFFDELAKHDASDPVGGIVRGRP